MKKGRLEAFSDGVIAIIITIMVLELKPPQGTSWETLKPMVPVFISYVMSFIYMGIYWNNHHHLLHTVNKLTAGILWSNLHLLFWLSLTPFASGWVGESHFSPWSMAFYGFVLLMSAIAYYILQNRILATQGKNSALARAIGKDAKGKISPLLYLTAIPCSFVSVWIPGAIYILVAIIWLIPDRRIERILAARED